MSMAHSFEATAQKALNESRRPLMESRLGAWKLALRRWQRDAFDAWWSEQPRDALVVATPGAGKTRFAARLAHAVLAERKVRRVLLVVPREHLKAQTAISLAQAGIRIDHRFENASGALASDVHGAAITYQQIAAAPLLYKGLTNVPTLVVLDEIHHAGDAASWGAALKEAFAYATHRISLSGTPFRSDAAPIPGVRVEPRGFDDGAVDKAPVLQREGARTGRRRLFQPTHEVARPPHFVLGRGEHLVDHGDLRRVDDRSPHEAHTLALLGRAAQPIEVAYVGVHALGRAGQPGGARRDDDA